ncbi:MAG: nitroreductase family protein [Candidatus Mucispirillum faecigallinarum]|nr:nitroreductase family protein [Candidatus Mucispirillum faecigallinarum]
MKDINESTIFIRRSIRSFIKEKKVEPEKIEILLRAAMQAPSACNKQPWEFLVLDDENVIDSIAPIDKHYVLAAKAPLVIFF